MRHLDYAMRFTGKATPANAEGTVLRAATSAPSSSIKSTVGPDGLAGAIEEIQGDQANFESEVSFSSATSFMETGSISFGNGHRLRFTTLERGYLAPSPDPNLQHGTVMWRIEDGEGQFAGARGLISSNFFVSADLDVTDHHYGVIWLP